MSARRSALADVSLLLARDDALVVGDLQGHHRHPDRFSRRFTETVAAARVDLGANALKGIRLHDLRHTPATLLLQAGVHPTLDVYSHAMPTIQREAVDRLALLVYGGPA